MTRRAAPSGSSRATPTATLGRPSARWHLFLGGGTPSLLAAGGDRRRDGRAPAGSGSSPAPR